MRITFRFRWIPFIATVLLVALGISLGQWQARRALEKEALEHKLSLRESAPAIALGATVGSVDTLEYQHVRLKGEFVRDWPLYLDNRSYKGMAGFYVVMPFRIAGTDSHVLVARGWTRRDMADRTKLPPLATPDGELELDGIAVLSLGKLFKLGKDEADIKPGDILQNVTPAGFSARSRLRTLPIYVQQRNALPDNLVRDWPRPAVDIDRHRGYMVTWYALALMAAIFYLVTGCRRHDHIKR